MAVLDDRLYFHNCAITIDINWDKVEESELLSLRSSILFCLEQWKFQRTLNLGFPFPSSPQLSVRDETREPLCELSFFAPKMHSDVKELLSERFLPLSVSFRK